MTAAQKNVENWFDSGMDRVSGWYKGHTHRSLFFTGLAMTVILNVDSIAIGQPSCSRLTAPKRCRRSTSSEVAPSSTHQDGHQRIQQPLQLAWIRPAVDVISFSRGWDRPESWFASVAESFKKVGCKGGGDWKLKDLPHFQWGACKPSPSDRARELIQTEGMERVWTEVGAA